MGDNGANKSDSSIGLLTVPCLCLELHIPAKIHSTEMRERVGSRLRESYRLTHATLGLTLLQISNLCVGNHRSDPALDNFVRPNAMVFWRKPNDRFQDCSLF